MNLKGIKLVTFDATNTLLQFRVPPWEYYAIIARNHGYNGSEENIKSRLMKGIKIMSSQYPNFGKSQISWEEWWRKIVKLTFQGQLPVSANIEAVASELIDDFKTSKCWYTAKGVKEVLQLLRQQEFYIGVISNFDPRLSEILHNVNIHSCLDFILTSYETGYSKPDKKIFQYALDKCGLDMQPTQALHIGDDLEKDYEGARAAGWHAILINKDLKIEKPPAQDHVFKTLDDLRVAIQCNTLHL